MHQMIQNRYIYLVIGSIARRLLENVRATATPSFTLLAHVHAHLFQYKQVACNRQGLITFFRLILVVWGAYIFGVGCGEHFLFTLPARITSFCTAGWSKSGKRPGPLAAYLLRSICVVRCVHSLSYSNWLFPQVTPHVLLMPSRLRFTALANCIAGAIVASSRGCSLCILCVVWACCLLY